jgi:hypothetical protein
MSNLAAKLSRLSNPAFPRYKYYEKACKEILGFVITNISSLNGQKPGIYLPDLSTLPIEQMGEGVPNIAMLLAQLAVSENKIFLIEEPENDLHPKALKALLELIAESSKSNQFVISTHSNIVVSHLCSLQESRLFKIESEPGVLPTTAKIEVVPPTAEARIKVLQELGYAFSDFDLWDGWLILEEASAERIIRDYLIPWFVPKLARVKTVSAGGITKVKPAFEDLRRLMLFTHLQPAYAGRAWVLVDGDESGEDAITKLREKFNKVPQEHFSTLDQPQFEMYYPSNFFDDAKAALGIQDKEKKRNAKKVLLDNVIDWLDEDSERAKSALSLSAASVIAQLQKIEAEFNLLTQQSRSNTTSTSV